MASANSGSDSLGQTIVSSFSSSKSIIVAAIDFGTTYSGYAFSFKDDYNKDPTKISANNWVAGSRALVSLKAPSTILLNKKKEFVAFGYDAEDQYSDLALDGVHKEYYYFRRFKMLLFSEVAASGLRRDMTIEDTFGKKIRALTVFSMSIKFLISHLMGVIANRLPQQIKIDDITWVLTVPAIWNDGAKQFMREAAIAAGIPDKNLIISLEPEAASLYCMKVPVEKLSKSSDTKGRGNVFGSGTKYMVLDVGGGTVDITIHQVVDSNTLKELNWASGGAWGGTRVDQAFENLIVSVTGRDVFDKFCKDHTADHVDLYREFETKKRNVISGKMTKETLRIPVSLMDVYKDVKKKSFKDAVDACRSLQGKVTATGDKLRIEADLFRGLFNDSIDNTIKHVRALLKEKASAGTNTILMVGGFSESPFLQESIKTNFPDKRLIIPDEAGLAVLKGAVLYGHNPVTISSRIAKCSYGIRVYRDFQDGAHPVAKKTTIGGRVKCKDVFAVHVKKGQELKVGEPQSSQRYTPLEADQLSLVFDIYISTDENPLFVTDVNCSYLGQLEVEVPDLSGGKDRGVFVNMIFGGTEIVVEAKEENTGKKKTAKFNFLQ